MGRDVSTTWVGALKTEARVGSHRVLSDEPVEHGGDDAAPTPVDYLLVALTAWMVTTVRLYAERRQIALHRIEARAHREPPSGKIATIETELLLDGDLDDEQRRKLHEVAARCPVTRTLIEGARITHA